MIKSNPNCPNVRCDGGVITTDGVHGTVCKKCNPEKRFQPFKIKSTFYKGQILFAIHEGAIISGPCIGFQAALISEKQWFSSREVAEFEICINTITRESVWKKEMECFKSQRALIISLKS